jgi:hypothetical protein
MWLKFTIRGGLEVNSGRKTGNRKRLIESKRTFSRFLTNVVNSKRHELLAMLTEDDSGTTDREAEDHAIVCWVRGFFWFR